MNMLKIIMAVLVIVLVISIVFAANFRIELLEKDEELRFLNTRFQENLSILSEKAAALNASESFMNTYLHSLGKYYSALDMHDEADRKFSKANEFFDDGYWSSALGWYWEALDTYNDTGKKYLDAKDAFNVAADYTSNVTYQNICMFYATMMNVSAIGTTYLYEAVNFFAESCEYYLDKDYTKAHESKDKAEEKMSYYNEEMLKVENYREELQAILREISS